MMQRSPLAVGRLSGGVACVLLLAGCGVITSQSVYEGVRSTEKSKAIVTDKSRGELPPYEQYEKERGQ